MWNIVIVEASLNLAMFSFYKVTW